MATDADVCLVATCSAKCNIYAHKECFMTRQTSSVWRKKHHDRGNDDSEMCIAIGCQARCKSLINRTMESNIEGMQKPNSKKYKREAVASFQVDDPSNPCCFMGKDGLPCRRSAVKDGACKLHAKDAALQKMMLQKLAQTGLLESATKDPAKEEPAEPVKKEPVKKEPTEPAKKKEVAVQVAMLDDVAVHYKDMSVRLMREVAQKENKMNEAYDELAKCRLLLSHMEKELSAVKLTNEKLAKTNEELTKSNETLAKANEDLTKKKNDDSQKKIAHFTKQRDIMIKAERTATIEEVREKIIGLLFEM